jgi:hypothetical protein
MFFLTLLNSTVLSSILASGENPWPNTQQKLVLVCKELKPNQEIGINEFVKDNKVCQWILRTLK